MRNLVIIGAALAALIGTPALAADMPLKAPPPPPVSPAWNWSGFYIGINGGYGWGQSTNPTIGFTDPTVQGFGNYLAAPGGNAFANLKPRGFIAGGQIGYDKQFNNFVLGIVADFDGADIKASTTNLAAPGPGFVPSNQSISEKLSSLGTVRAKAGFAANNWLFYGTGGLAYGRVQDAMSFATTPGSITLSNSTSQERSGWGAGAGVMYGWANWEIGMEWLHYDLGRVSVTAPVTAPPALVTSLAGTTLTASQRVAGDVVRGVLSYKFGY